MLFSKRNENRAWSLVVRLLQGTLRPHRVAFSRVGWFSRALAFRSHYYPWGKMRDSRSLAPSTPTRRIKNMRFQNVRISFLAWVERSDDRKYACVRRLCGHCLMQKEGRSFVVFTIRALINIKLTEQWDRWSIKATLRASTLLDADKRRIEEEYVYLDMIIKQRNGNGCREKSTLQGVILNRNFIESWLTMI